MSDEHCSWPIGDCANAELIHERDRLQARVTELEAGILAVREASASFHDAWQITYPLEKLLASVPQASEDK